MHHRSLPLFKWDLPVSLSTSDRCKMVLASFMSRDARRNSTLTKVKEYGGVGCKLQALTKMVVIIVLEKSLMVAGSCTIRRGNYLHVSCGLGCMQ